MVEVVDDTVIEEQFTDDSGYAYKPDGWGASFAEGSFTEETFNKETNQDEADWSDILFLFDILHSEERLTDPAVWRENLESVCLFHGIDGVGLAAVLLILAINSIG